MADERKPKQKTEKGLEIPVPTKGDFDEGGTNRMEDGDPRKKLAYEESIRALKQQSSALDDLRARTGILLAALALSASFLGARALDISGFSGWSWAATGCFAAAGLFSLGILWPKGDWHFTSNAKIILKDANSERSYSLDELYETYAESNQEDWEENSSKRLKWLFWSFRLAVVALVLQVGFWLVALGYPNASIEKTRETAKYDQQTVVRKSGAQNGVSQNGVSGAAQAVTGRNSQETP